jgi:hypothetical protein
MDKNSISPLGLNFTQVNQTFELDGGIRWCAVLDYTSLPSFDGVIYLFPILRIENYEDETESYVGSQTRDLMYTLGVCYAILFCLFTITLVCFSFCFKYEFHN